MENKKNSAMQLMMLSKYEPVDAIQKENRNGWVDYGDENQYPNYLLNLYKNSPVHNALVNSIAFMISGKGTNTILDNAIDGVALDLKLHGYFFSEVIWSLDGTRPAKINHLPVDECRLCYNEEIDEVTGIYFSKDWKNWRAKKNTPIYIPFIDPKNTIEQPRQVVYGHIMNTGGSYYSQPDYIGGMNYIELSYQMGLYHVNNILNGLFPSFIVSFVNGVPERDARQQIRREWEEMLSGASNAGKFIMTFDEEPEHTPQIKDFPLSDADKQYQFLSEETTKQIMIAHRVTSPLLFGIRDASGLGSNKDEMTIAMKIFNSQVIEPYQRIIVNSFSALFPDLSITPNTPLINDEVVTAVPTQDVVVDTTKPEEVVTPEDTNTPTEVVTPEVKVSDVTYNGAQIASALEIVAKVKEGALTTEQAIVFLVQFLQLDVEIAKSMFQTGGNAVAQLSNQKKKEKQKREKNVDANISDENSTAWLKYLESKIEYLDEEEWECVSNEQVTDPHNEKNYMQEYMNAMPSKSYADPNPKSSFDKGLYKVRYAYSQNLSEKSREFCRTMVGWSNAGALFRYEDIIEMGDDGVNGDFAPTGENSYSIWEWKGGAFCHHFWTRKVFFRKRKNGKFLPNEGMKNEEEVEGKVPNIIRKKGKESIAPINTPSRGSLKY